ncbi:MAG: hypothetical protein UW85_C0008G0002 [Parcubacteria group bacterium GW2011_GWA1_Parcubacteria_45_10]|nr:MAG: hypothetical protein UW85_C0008G0002 [Parcubacteria group bacterium GW2011_GWA1_Parcubacteria_45_10]
MKQFLIFAGDTYYPSGGWQDFIGSENTKEEALLLMSKRHYDWWQVVDSQTGNIVDSFSRGLWT